jgi:hypothetical protein
MADQVLQSAAPETGHGLNLHFSYPFTYNKVNEFFVDNGLGPSKSRKKEITKHAQASLGHG